MTPIKGSSTVKGVIYEPKTKELTIQFHSGGPYKYDNVTKQQHESLMTAKSRGKWVHEHLVGKEKQHPVTKLSDEKKTLKNSVPSTIKPPSRHVLGMGKFLGNYQQPPAP